MTRDPERLVSRPREHGASCGRYAWLVALSVSLSPGCSDGPEEPVDSNASHDAQGTDVGEPSMENVSDGASGPEDQSDCRLPREEDLRFEHPANESEAVFNEVLPSHLERLYQAVGRFASGDVKVFRGSVDVLEHRSVVEGSEDLVLSSTRAVASFGYEGDGPFTSDRVVLTLFDPDTRQMLRMVQANYITQVCGIDSFYSNCLSSATCDYCLPEQSAVSDTLSLSFTALGRYGDLDQSEKRIDVHVDLDVVPHDALSMDDILILNSTLQSPFPMMEPTLEGDTYLFEVEGSINTGATDENGCDTWLSYESEWFVHRECLLDYGLRESLRLEPFSICPVDQG